MRKTYNSVDFIPCDTFEIKEEKGVLHRITIWWYKPGCKTESRE